MKIAIVDDSKQDQSLLLNHLNTFLNNHTSAPLPKISVYDTSTDFLEEFSAGFFDLIFLDIYIDQLTGLDLAEKIRSKDKTCLIIFSTISPEHAIDGYNFQATHYLLKPYTYKSIEKALFLSELFTDKKYGPYITVTTQRISRKILVDEIVFTDYYKHYIYIHLKNKEILKIYLTFRDFSELLSCYPQFLCCYRGCLVNMDYISRVLERDFLLTTNEHVPFRKPNKKEILEHYHHYVFQKSI
ncbi:MAG: LytR/AlgR family response regulator transcription factor [Eubacteriaceae bacterium]